MKRFKDIEVELYFLLPEEGGRTTPITKNTIYRPQFYYNKRDWVADHQYPDIDTKIYPGDTVKAFLTFMSPQEHINKVFKGMEFLIREGSRTVARGKIVRILELGLSSKYYSNN
ncbi:MAG: hypothetical protein L3J43_06520 [Sulfurovum sp.]|nr:hypothetical protein [Sulfurovum sp.]